MSSKNCLSQVTERYQAALDFHSQGDVEQAIGLYFEVLKEFPEADVVMYNLGLALYESGEFLAAKESFERAIAVNSGEVDYWFNLALSCKKTDCLKETVTAYRQALELSPDDMEILYSFGCYCQDIGALEEAVLLYSHILEQDSSYIPAVNNLAYIHHLLDNHKEAEKLYHLLLKLNPDHAGAEYMLAAIQGNALEAPPEEYVKSLFDQYSDDFENNLLEDLEYRAPEKLWELFNKNRRRQAYAHTLDLGCGTGLCGLFFHGVTRSLDGIDLSPKMIERAREKNIYTFLQDTDMLKYLKRTEKKYDLFLAADVFIYLGELDPLFAALHKVALPGAHVLFSVEDSHEVAWQLQSNGRYSHNHEYIMSMADGYAFTLVAREKTELRKEKGEGVAGLLYFLEKTS